MGAFDALFEGTEEEILGQDSFAGAKIEKSGVYLFKITMAKQKDSGSSNSKAFVLELEAENGARVFHDMGWYINKEGGFTDKNGKVLSATAAVVRLNNMLTGSKDLPALTAANIKEYNWEAKAEVTVNRMIARDLIGKIVKAQVVRVRSNKQVKSGGKTPEGYDIYVDGPDEKFTNEVKRFYDGITGQTVGEKQLGAAAEAITKDIEYCEKTPVLDKFKNVAPIAQNGGASAPQQGFGNTNQAANAGFGSDTAPQQGFGA